jgi:hypothetical protein
MKDTPMSYANLILSLLWFSLSKNSLNYTSIQDRRWVYYFAHFHPTYCYSSPDVQAKSEKDDKIGHFEKNYQQKQSESKSSKRVSVKKPNIEFNFIYNL